MRYIDRTGSKYGEKAKIDKEVKSLGALSRTACAIAENKSLAVLKTSWGPYKVIRECGLGKYEDTFETLEQVDAFIKGL